MTTVSLGASFEVDAHGTALGGAVVARLPDGRVCFIAGGIPGERLVIEVTAIRKSYAEAMLVRVVVPSPDRVTPPCAVYGRCGGCQYQHVAYERQVQLKTRQLTDVLQRIGGLQLTAIDEIHAAPAPWAYRNRIELHPMADRSGHGYITSDDRTVVAITACPIARPEVNAAIAGLPTPPAGAGAEDVRASIRWAPGNGTVAWTGPEPTDLPWRIEQVGGQAYSVPSGSFAQVNPAVAEVLFTLVGRWLSPLGAGRVVDAYCGAGFLGLAVSGGPVLGLETDARSITAARANAVTRGVASTHTYVTGNVDLMLEKQLAPNGVTTCLILDPPRAGCGAATLRAVASGMPEWILYVSCEPSTLARDLKAIVPLGYQVERTAFLDMFPQTAHFESAILLVRQAGSATAT